MSIQEDGYYKICYQDWWEDEESKTGWTGTDWGEGEDYELVDYLEFDKYENPTKALFKYNGFVFLGVQHAAYNLQASLLSEFVGYAKKYHGKTFEEVYELEPEFKKLNNAIDVLEERFEVKNYLNKQ